MKTIVKVLCVLMCLLMALSVLSACKKNDKPDNPSDNTDTSADPADQGDQNNPENPDDPNNPGDQKDPDGKDDPDGKTGDLLVDKMQAKYPDKEVIGIAYPEDLLALIGIVNASSNIRALTENTVYYLAGDVDVNPYWVAEATLQDGELSVPYEPSNPCAGFQEFYGIFDGNGHTLSGLYILNDDVISYDCIGLFGELYGTVKDLTLENCFVSGKAGSGDSYTNISIGVLAGSLIGDDQQVENVTVKSSYVVYSGDTSPDMGGVIGRVEGDNPAFRSVSFEGGQLILTNSNESYPPSAKDIVMSQIVGFVDGDKVLFDQCLAGGLLFGVEAVAEEDSFCAPGDAIVTLRDCRIEPPVIEPDPEGVISLRTKRDLLALDPTQNYAGITIRLMNDIDLNPGWQASEAEYDSLKLPTYYWTGLPEFSGTFDGQGFTIFGLCKIVDLDKADYAGGLIDQLNAGAVIQNLTISNSAIFAYNSTEKDTNGVMLGGLIAWADGNTLVKDSTIDFDIWTIGNVSGSIGNIQSTDESASLLTTENVTALGDIGSLDADTLKDYIPYLDPFIDRELDRDDIIWIETADDLMAFMKKAQDGEDYEGETICLAADIDLNPGVKMTATINPETNRLEFPDKTKIVNEWLGIPTFKGTFDGNGHSISGIYSWRNAISKNSGSYGGFIDTASTAAVIKNLIITNSIHVVNNTGDGAWGSRNMYTGGLVARNDKPEGVENTFSLTVSKVYLDMDVILLCSNHGTVGGIIGFNVRHGESYTSPYQLSNVVFAGRIINTDYTLKVPFTSPKDQFAMAQIVADTNWGSQHKISNTVAAGEIICGNTKAVNPIFGAITYSGVTCSNVVSARHVKIPKGAYDSKKDEETAPFNGTSWVYDHYLGFYVPQLVSNMIARNGGGLEILALLQDNAENTVMDTSLDEIHVKTAAELIALAKSGKDFSGATIYLDADIDLNPGWSAATKVVDGKVVFPDAPTVTWTAFANFKGRINGQGHTISGLYSKRTVSDSKGNYGLLIDTQSDGSIRNLAIVNSILLVENNGGNPAVHDLSIGGLVGQANKTTVKSADAGKDKYALGNSEAYGFILQNFFTDAEVWLVSKSNALIGGFIGSATGDHTIQHIVFAGKVGNTNALDGTGSASFAASNGSNLAIGQILGWSGFRKGYLEDAIVVGQIITGTSSTYIHTYVGADDKFGYGRCNTTLSATRPANVDEDDGWVLSEGGFYVHSGIVDFANKYQVDLALTGELLGGVTIVPKETTSNVTLTATSLAIKVPEGVTTIGASAFAGYVDLLNSVSLPSTLKTIGNSAFSGCTSLSEIELPDALENIGDSAFAGCTLLSKINFSAALTTIGNSAFSGCTSLSEIELPDALESIGNSAFAGCTLLSKIDFPAALITIGNSAFENCALITKVVLPDSVTTIGASSFKGCPLTTLKLSAGLTFIGKASFEGCTTLTDVALPKSLETIGASAFAGCTSLKVTGFSDTKIRTIDQSAFADCTSLGAIELPKTVIDIANSAFEGCTNLKLTTIPASVGYIGTDAFKGCPNLTDLTFEHDTAVVSLVIQVGAFDKIETLRAPSTFLFRFRDDDAIKKNVTTLYVTSGEALEKNTIINYPALTSITLPSTLVTIKAGAFNNCPALTAITIPASVTTIEGGAFLGMTALASYAVEEGNETYKAIEDDLYKADGTLLIYAEGKSGTSFTIPKVLTAIAANVFKGSKVTSVFYSGTKAEWTASGIKVDENAFDTVMNIICTNGETCMIHTPVVEVEAKDPTCTEAGTTMGSHCSVCNETLVVASVIPALGHNYVNGFCTHCGAPEPNADLDFTSNGDGTCYISSIGTITDATVSIPAESPDGDKVIAIGENAFKDCAFVTGVELFDGIVSIGDYAFAGTSITDITLPDTVTSIGKGAFSDCKITSIKIPDSVTSVGENAFSGCPIESAKIPAFACSAVSNSKLETLTITRGENIEEKAFLGVAALTSITLPNSLTSIGASAFADTGITSITLPDGLLTIGDYAFAGTAITSIKIPDSVTSVGENAFSGCPIEDATIPAVACSAVSNSELKALVITSGESIEEKAFLGVAALTSISLPDGLETIGDYAFAGTGITGITLPDGLLTIGDFAFMGTAITSIKIPASVTKIGTGAFANCSSLVIDFNTVASGNAGGYTSNEDGIFANTNNGKTQTLVRYTSSQYKTSYTAQKSVTKIEDYAFSGCVYLTAIGAAGGRNANPNYKGSSYLYSKDGKTFVAFPAGKNNTSYEIDAGTVNIANGAFWGCTNLTSVTLPTSIESIGDYAFYGCTNLETVVNNATNLKHVGADAFVGTKVETPPTGSED